MQLEKQLTDALVQTRTQKTQLMLESVEKLREQEKTLKQENEQLKDEVGKLVDNRKIKNHIDSRFNGPVEVDTNIQCPQPKKTLPLLW
ncbi:MADS-box transcription factor 17 [Bienertia sinuspersici]